MEQLIKALWVVSIMMGWWYGVHKALQPLAAVKSRRAMRWIEGISTVVYLLLYWGITEALVWYSDNVGNLYNTMALATIVFILVVSVAYEKHYHTTDESSVAKVKSINLIAITMSVATLIISAFI